MSESQLQKKTRDNVETEGTARLALTAEQVAQVMGISRSHVWRLHSSGHLPCPVRLGRAVRWDRKTLEAWLEAGGPPRDRWEARRHPS